MGNVIMSGIVPPLTAPSNLPAKGTALNDLTWEEIRAISDAGRASEYFNVGDAKTITINGKVGETTFSNLSVDAVIIGINHNADVEGTNRIHFQIGKISNAPVCFVDSQYGNTGSSSGAFRMCYESAGPGWDACTMRTAILGSDATPTSPKANTLLAALPSDMLAVLKPVTKYSSTSGLASNDAEDVAATTDYLWLLAEFEVHGARTYANSAEQNYQSQYDYYKAGNSKVRNRHNATTTAAYWWLRSTHYNITGTFCRVNKDGAAGSCLQKYSQGIAPCFAV